MVSDTKSSKRPDHQGHDPQKVQAAIAKRFNKKKNNMNYYICVGGMLIICIIGIGVALIQPVSDPTMELVNDPSLIKKVNHHRSLKQDNTFVAASSDYFAGMKIKDAIRIGSIGYSETFSHTQCGPKSLELPHEFDVRARWSHCYDTSEPYDGGYCASSHAVTVTSVINERICISTGDIDRHTRSNSLSPQTILSCDTSSMGCDGGLVDTAFRLAEKEGLHTQGCFPYRSITKNNMTGLPPCSDACTDEDRVRISSACYAATPPDIKAEIITGGPVVARFPLYDDFLVYSSGVYKPDNMSNYITDENKIIKSVVGKILGWGRDGLVPYWIVEMPFGKDWGVDGVAFIYFDSSKKNVELMYDLVMVPLIANNNNNNNINNNNINDNNDAHTIEDEFE
eukprot:GHVR01035828.1.p1 GENE.GHVR01035828.1~~GHVR01035828.1.p1  ORF type:complete len:396 (+),score=109.19 GHVR01035828.1:64-1251(+)